MLVPLGGGTTDGSSIMSPMTKTSSNISTQKIRSELNENMRKSRESLQDQNMREKDSQIISGNRKKDATTPLDLTKSQDIEDEEFIHRNSISPSVSNAENNIKNRLRNPSGGSEMDETSFPANTLPPTTSQRKNKGQDSPVTDLDQRTSLGNLIPPIIPPLPGGISEAMLSAPGGALLPQQEAILKMQQKEFEAQLSFLKNKHLEFLKNQQHIQGQRQSNVSQSHPPSNVSRCEECNINFSKHQNYVAHKKYYCSANANKANPPTNTMQIVSDNDDEELSMPSQPTLPLAIHPQISPRVSPPKKDISPSLLVAHNRPATKPLGQRTPSVSPSASISSNQSASQGMSTMAMQAAAQAAINNFLAMTNAVPGKELLNGSMTKELLLLKQQQELLTKDNILSKEAAFHALKNATIAPANPVGPDNNGLNSNRPDSSSPTPQDRILLPSSATSKTPPTSSMTSPPSHANIPPGLPLTHFCCEGCGIKFKSVSNLQAHQARYCAGLRKGGGEEGGIGNPFETMIKRMTTQQQNTAAGQGPSLPTNQLMNGIQADMMSFLNARSLEQQLQHAEALKAAAATKHRSESLEKEDVNPPSAGPAAMAAMAAAISAAKVAPEQPSNGASSSTDIPLGVNDDYCCILCGYKESSVERLKDHINMHFIGHVKKPAPLSPRSLSPNNEKDQSRKSKSPRSPQHSAERMSKHNVNGTENGMISPPEPKKIKLEAPSGSESSREKSLSAISPPMQRNRSDTHDVLSPKADIHASGASALSAKLIAAKKNTPQQELNYPNINDTSNNVSGSGDAMRCTSCDIGFSQISNYLAHKKYYCRGLLSASPTGLDIKPSPSSEPVKLRNVILPPDRVVDEDATTKK